MAQFVQTPWGELEFPDEMSQDQIVSAIKNTPDFQGQPEQPQPAVQQGQAQSMLSQEERDAITGAGSRQAESGTGGFLGAAKLFGREAIGSIIRGADALAKASGGTDFDNMNRALATLEYAERERAKGRNVSADEVGKFALTQPTTLGQLGSSLESAVPVDQSVKDSFGGQVAQGFGQVLGQVGLAAATGGRSAPAQLATFVSSLGQVIDESYQQAKTSALNKGMTEAEAEKSAREVGVKGGLVNVLPEYLLDRTILGKFLKPFEGKGFTFKQVAQEVGKTAAVNAPVGGVTEMVQGWVTNGFIKAGIDPDQEITEGSLREFGVGAVVQGGATAMGRGAQGAAVLADPENKAINLENRINQQAAAMQANQDSLRLAANLPAGSTQESYNLNVGKDGKTTTEAVYNQPDGRRVSVKVTGTDSPSVTPNPLLLEAPKPQAAQGEGTPVPVGTQTTQRMDREGRKIVEEQSPVAGPVILTPPPIQPDDRVRLDMKDYTNGEESFIEGDVLPDKSGIRITYIPPSLEGSSQQLKDASTPRGVPVKQPKVGDVVPLSVAQGDFRVYGYRPSGAWYSNMAAPRPVSTVARQGDTQEAKEPTISQVQSNRQTLAAASRLGSQPQPQAQPTEQRAFFPQAPDRMQLPRQEPPKPQPSVGKRRATKNEKRIVGEGRAYFPTAPDRMQYSQRFGIPSQEQKAQSARSGAELEGSLRRIAPKGAQDLGILLGLPQGMPAGTRAAYDPKRGLIHLSDKIASFPEQVGEFTHEAGHVFWDTLPQRVKLAAAKLYGNEMASRSGPLFEANGNLREGISPRVASGERTQDSSAEWDTLGLREWFAERIMSENSAWANDRANTTSLLGRAANAFRTALQRIGGALGKGDAINNAFKSWALLGPRYGIDLQADGDVVASMRNALTQPLPEGEDREVASANSIRGADMQPINQAVRLAQAELAELDRKFHDKFFEEGWPKWLRAAGQMTLKPTKENLELMAMRGVNDIVSFVAQNPDYAKYYNLDLAQVDSYLTKAFPEVAQDPQMVKAFRIFTALTSPDTSLEENMGEAVNVFSLWLKDRNLDSIEVGRSKSNIPIVAKSPFTFLGKTGGNKAMSVKIVADMINKIGADKTAEFLQGTQELRSLNKYKRELGYKSGLKGPAVRQVVMEATGQDKQIPNAFLFGPKVGSYLMNWLGDSRFTTIDIWESRFARSYFPAYFRKVIGVDDAGNKELNTGLAEGSERAMIAKFATIFNRKFEEQTGLKLEQSALQALRWFYIIDATARAGYKGAQSNATSSEYTRRALAERGLLDEDTKEDWRRGVEGGRRPVLLESFRGRISYKAGQGEGFAGRIGADSRQYALDEISAEDFSSIAASNKSASKFGTSVDVLGSEQYAGYDLVVASWNGETATISVSPDGEIGAVTKSQKAPSTLVRVAMDAALYGRGGKGLWLSAFDTVLPDIYSSYGFQPVARMAFNDDYRPDGWDYKAYGRYKSGRPDVVFMKYAGDFTPYADTKDSIQTINDYGVGVNMAKDGVVQQSVRGPQSVRGAVFAMQPPAQPQQSGISIPQAAALEANTNASVAATLGFRLPPEDTNKAVMHVRKHIDKFKDFAAFKKELAKRGVTLGEKEDFHEIEQNMHGVVGAKMEKLYDTQEEILEDVKSAGLGNPSRAIIGGQEVGATEMDLYLYATHAKERNAYILQEYGEQNGSGMSDAEADTILRALLPKTAAAARIAQRVYDLNRQKLSLMEETGLISKQARQAIETRYPHYVPLLGRNGATEEESTSTSRNTGGMTMVGRDITPAKGRYSAAANVLAQSFVSQQRAVVRAERNRALLSLKRFVDAYPDSGMLEPVTELRSGETAESSNIITYKVDGQNKYLRVLKPWLEDSFRGSAGRVSQVVEWLGGMARLIGSLLTTYNPLFPLPNFSRDTLAATLNLSSTELAGMEGSYAKMLIPSLRAVFIAESKDYKKSGLSPRVSPKMAKFVKYYDEFKANGGQMIYLGLRDAEYYAKQVQKRSTASGTGLQKVGSIIKDTYSDMMEYVNLGFENANRLATYSLAREKGLSPQRAANLARNITTNFTMRGQQSGAISRMFMFYQASLNGTYRMMQNLASPRGQAAAAGIFMTALIQRIVARALDDKDEEAGVKEIEGVPEFTLATNIVQPLPYSDFFLKLPIPYGYNIIWYAGIKAADALPIGVGGRGESVGSAAMKVAATAIGTLNPLGGGQQLVDSVIPSPLQPFSEIKYNTNFANQPVYPKDNPFDATPEPYAFRHWSNVNPTLRDTMEGIARLTGGNEVRPSYFEKALGLVGMEALASPESVNHLARAMFGGPYSVASDVSTTISGAMSGNFSANTLPVVRRFVGQADDRSYGMIYREVVNATSLAHEELRLANKTGNKELAARTRAEYGPELASYPDLSRTEYVIKGMRTRAKDLEAKGNQEAADQIREKVVLMQRQALGRYYKRVDEGK